MTQKDAVFVAVRNVLISAGVNFQVGITNVSSVLDRTLRSKVTSTLVDRFVNDEVELSDDAKGKSIPELRSYISGLISNWLRKDERLNGGNRTLPLPNKDPQLKALRQLLAAQSDENNRAQIQTFIDKRLSELS